MFNFTINFDISYSYFLIAYLLAIGMILFFAAASLYHLVKYGFMSPLGMFMTLLLIAGTMYVLLLSYEALAAIDWKQQISIGQSANSFAPF
ncbi:TPA: hypothetical protein DIC39_03900 [Patescibacteria group bacterium]|nr:hypothetical protein [Patescibacteria group bacterium]HCU48166.1 hypothetical protein [Patescibacteria group bacterium]